MGSTVAASSEIQRGSPDAKLGRAEEHLEVLEKLIDSFVESKPYRLALQSRQEIAGLPPPEIPHFDLMLRSLKPIPDKIGLAFGDVLTNLRAALDHLAWNLVLARRGKPDRHTAFPIKLRKPRRPGDGRIVPLKISGGVRREAMAIIKAAQPYERADRDEAESHPLWVLDRLVGIDKHRHLPLCVVGMSGITSYVEGVPVPWAQMDPPRPLDDQTPICTFAIPDPAAHMDMDLEISTTVALGEGEPSGGKPLGDVAQELTEAVRGLLNVLTDHAA